MSYKVAVVGATGNVGREMLSILAERQFPRQRSGGPGLHAFDRQGRLVRRRDPEGEGARHYDFKGTDICLMSAGSKVSKEWSPKIAAQGAS